MKNRGISLIALIITIAVIIIIAGATIQNGMKKTDQANIAKHNTNISSIQEEVESYYYYKGGELPVVDMTRYPIESNQTLLGEITKNSEQDDKFYTLDLSKLGKVGGSDGSLNENDIYIVSETKHTVYYVKGTKVKGLVYHGLVVQNNGGIAQVEGITPTIEPTATPTNAPSYTYDNPIIPSGFTYVGQTWDNGFTIQDVAGNQFVWIPALAPEINSNGTLDGTNFNSKFGRRKFKGETFNASAFYETNDMVLQNMTTSVNTYGGFYIAKYEASNDGNGRGQSKANITPWTIIDWDTSKAKAEAMDTDWGWDTNVVESYLCYGAHWDTVLQWLIDSGDKTLAQIKDDSTSWGNYYNDTFSGTTAIGNTGKWNQTLAKGIYDLAGNAWEWTMENNSNLYRVYRGGDYYDDGYSTQCAYRNSNYPTSKNVTISWRSVLYIK